jgi:hypothetical protein
MNVNWIITAFVIVQYLRYSFHAGCAGNRRDVAGCVCVAWNLLGLASAEACGAAGVSYVGAYIQECHSRWVVMRSDLVVWS